jgi:hypothetical protein
MQFIGYFASLAIGLSLGLIGGGGSVLTVPVLVYLMGVEPVLASAYSLFIVGATSLVGSVPKYRQGSLDLRMAVIFGAPSILAVYATRKYVIPNIPHHLFNLAGLEVTKPIMMMVLFAILMVLASVSMIRNGRVPAIPDGGGMKLKYPLILLEGALVGFLTGMVGAGGGFIIIPALVLFSGLPMQKAVGTSLLIIAAKSLIGFAGDLSHTAMDWRLLLTVTALAVVGIFLGDALGRKVDGDRLKKWFGWFVLSMGVMIIIQQLFFPMAGH